MSVLTVYPSLDGYVYNWDLDTWLNKIAGDGDSLSYTSTTSLKLLDDTTTTTTDQWSIVMRGFVQFDTSSLGSGSTISSAIMSFYKKSLVDGLSMSPTIGMYGATINGTISDYQSVGSTLLSSTKGYSSWNTGAYSDLTLNSSGRTYINKIGDTDFSALETVYDAGSSTPTWVSDERTYVIVYPSEDTGTTRDPKLVVTYTTGGATNVTVEPSVLETALVLNSPTVTAIQNITVEPSVLVTNLVLNSPTVITSGDIVVQPSVLETTLVLNSPTVTAIENVTIEPSVLVTNLVLNSPTVLTTGDVTVQPSVLNTSLVLNSPTVITSQDITVTPSVLSIGLVLNSPTVLAGKSIILPEITSDNHGTEFVIKDADLTFESFPTALLPTGADTIENESDLTMNKEGESVIVVADNVKKDWKIKSLYYKGLQDILWDRTGTTLTPKISGDVLNVGDGVGSKPSYSFENDPNTGMYSTGSDQIGWSRGGVEQMKLTGSGLQINSVVAFGASPVTVRGLSANNASAVGVVLNASTELTVDGAKIVDFQNNEVSKAYIDYLGGAYFESNVGIGTTTPTQKLDIDTGHLVFHQVVCPVYPTVALAGLGAGNLSNGTYRYRIQFITATEQTNLGSYSYLLTVVDNSTDGQVEVDLEVSPNEAVVARKIYRTKVGGSSTYFYPIATISDNTTTSYIDNIPDTSLTGDRYNLIDNTTSSSIFVDSNRVLLLGQFNTLMGIGAGSLITTGSYNTLLGRDAGKVITTGSQNFGLGNAPLASLTSGVSNVAIGTWALLRLTTGSNNVAIGRQALISVTTSAGNVGLGQNSGLGITSGYYNICLGDSAGYKPLGIAANKLTTGSYNVNIGFNSGFDSPTQYTNTIVIGKNAIVTGSNQCALGGLVGASDAMDLVIGKSFYNTGGGRVKRLVTKTADYAMTNTDYAVIADANSNTVTITLPLSPVTGQEIKVICSDSTNVVTVGRNGKLLSGNASDDTIVKGEVVILNYDSTSGSWW